MKKSLALLLMCGFIFAVTCTKDMYGPDACFNEQVLPIFISNCTMSGCHNSTNREAGYDLTNYEGIMKGIKAKHPLFSEIFNSIRGKNPSMPRRPYPKLSTKDVNMIKLWINMGARNTSNCQSCDTTTFSYKGRIKNIMELWCTGCHNSGNSGGGFDLSYYGGVVQATLNDKLHGSIKHLPGFSPMPKNAAQLQQCDINAIEKWIKAGCPDN